MTTESDENRQASWRPWAAALIVGVAVGVLATLALGYVYQTLLGVGTPNEVHDLHPAIQWSGSAWLYGSTGLSAWWAYSWFKAGPAKPKQPSPAVEGLDD